MLVLPTGQIYVADFSKDVEIYTPTDDSASFSWLPSIENVNNINVATCLNQISFFFPCLTISQKANILDGLQLNGLSQGAAYGDDYQSSH